MGFQLIPAVAHSDGEEGLAEHGNVVHAVAEDDSIFRAAADEVQHAQDAAALVGRFDEVRVVDVFQVGQAVCRRFVFEALGPGVHDFIDGRQVFDGDRADDGFHVIARVVVGEIRIRRIAVDGIVRDYGPGIVAVRQVAQQGFAVLQGQAGHFQNFPVQGQAVAAIGDDGWYAVAVGKGLRIVLQAARCDGYEMAFLDEAAQAVQRVCRDDAGDSQAQGPVDIKEKVFFRHESILSRKIKKLLYYSIYKFLPKSPFAIDRRGPFFT